MREEEIIVVGVEILGRRRRAGETLGARMTYE
jgi:hypothetical protein